MEMPDNSVLSSQNTWRAVDTESDYYHSRVMTGQHDTDLRIIKWSPIFTPSPPINQ